MPSPLTVVMALSVMALAVTSIAEVMTTGERVIADKVRERERERERDYTDIVISIYNDHHTVSSPAERVVTDIVITD